MELISGGLSLPLLRPRAAARTLSLHDVLTRPAAGLPMRETDSCLSDALGDGSPNLRAAHRRGRLARRSFRDRGTQ